MIAAALLAVALQAVASPSHAASTAPKPYPCAPTVAGALTAYAGKARLEPGFAVHAYDGYALVLYGVKNGRGLPQPSGLGSSAWFKQRGTRWCVIVTGSDSFVAPAGVPYPTARHVMESASVRTRPRP